MTVERLNDPLARYLEDMLTEPEAGEASTAPESAATAVAQEEAATSPSGLREETAAPASNTKVEWWGFGVAHLILVLPGEAVSGVRETCDPAWLSDDGKLLQGHVEMDQQYLLLDAARMVLPDEHFAKLPPLSHRAGGVVQLKEAGMALLCDSQPMPVTISEDEVRWRQGAGPRRWMAGTIMNRSMVVLDVAGLLETASRGG